MATAVGEKMDRADRVIHVRTQSLRGVQKIRQSRGCLFGSAFNSLCMISVAISSPCSAAFSLPEAHNGVRVGREMPNADGVAMIFGPLIALFDHLKVAGRRPPSRLGPSQDSTQGR